MYKFLGCTIARLHGCTSPFENFPRLFRSSVFDIEKNVYVNPCNLCNLCLHSKIPYILLCATNVQPRATSCNLIIHWFLSQKQILLKNHALARFWKIKNTEFPNRRCSGSQKKARACNCKYRYSCTTTSRSRYLGTSTGTAVLLATRAFYSCTCSRSS